MRGGQDLELPDQPCRSRRHDGGRIINCANMHANMHKTIQEYARSTIQWTLTDGYYPPDGHLKQRAGEVFSIELNKKSVSCRGGGAAYGTHGWDLCDFSHTWGRYRHARPRFVRFFAHVGPLSARTTEICAIFRTHGAVSGREARICAIFRTRGAAFGAHDRHLYDFWHTWDRERHP